MGEYANKAIGKTKKAIGKVTGNRRFQTEGTIQEYTGKAQGGAKKVGRAVQRASANLRRKTDRPGTGRRRSPPSH